MTTPRHFLVGLMVALAAGACSSVPSGPAAAVVAGSPAGPATATGPLAFMHGEWSGPATVVGRDGKPIQLTQTERVGPMMDGALTVIEGRGYGAAGDLQFNAFAVVSQNRDGTWQMQSYANGNSGAFPFEPKPDGYVWSTPAGPDAVTRYTATFTGDRWDQIGEYVPKTGEPRKIFEMHLRRTGSTTWPQGGYVAPPSR